VEDSRQVLPDRIQFKVGQDAILAAVQTFLLALLPAELAAVILVGVIFFGRGFDSGFYSHKWLSLLRSEILSSVS